MQELIVFTGNIGTGKSTIAAKYAKKGYVVVNMDTITRMVHGGEYGLYDGAKKDVYQAAEVACIMTGLEQGFSVVVDRTNMKASDRARYIGMGRNYDGVSISSLDFGPGDPASLARRIGKPNGIPSDQWVDVGCFMQESYQKPSTDEGFDACCQSPDRFTFYAVDFDGTIVENKFPEIGAIVESKVEEMQEWWILNENIIIIWTCRSGDYLNQMRAFLLKNDIPFDFINENPIVNYGSPKIFAHEYHDDRNAPQADDR